MTQANPVSFLVFFIFFPLGAFAQLTITPHVGLGVGHQIWKIDGTRLIDDDIYSVPRPTYELGISASYPIADNLSLVGGASVSSRGGSRRFYELFSSDGYSFRAVNNIHYFIIPFGVEYSSGSMILEAGLAPGAAISGKVKYISIYDGDRDADTDRLSFGNDEYDDDLFRLDASLYGGGRIPFGSEGAEIGIRGYLGMRSLAFDPDNTLRNNALFLFLSYPVTKNL